MLRFPSISPDGKWLVIPSSDPKGRHPELRLYELETGKKSIYPIPAG